MSVLLDALRKAAAEKQVAGSDLPKAPRPGQNQETIAGHRFDTTKAPLESPAGIASSEKDGSVAVSRDKHSLAVEPALSTVGDADWSLSQIPGYQTESLQEEVRRNQAHGVLQAMRSTQKHASHPVRWLGGSALAVFIFAGLGYYGWAYFQMQTQAMNRDLAGYQTATPVMSASSKNKALPSSHTVAAVEARPAPDMAVASDEAGADMPAKTALNPETKQRLQKPSKELESPPPVTPERHLKIVAVTEPTEAEKGYQAYQAGQLKQARHFYTLAYQQDAENIAALFGLAAVAVKQGQKSNALRYYQRIVELDPQNQAAQDAVLMLNSQMQGDTKTIGSLAERARRFPNNAALQAARGHQLAQKNDWVAAQKQYFKAYQLAPDRGDYALNLAVSLDKLGEYALAKQYYEVVLQASNNPLSAKRKEQVRQRVTALQAFLKQEANAS